MLLGRSASQHFGAGEEWLARLGTLSRGAGPALQGGIPQGSGGWQNRECPHMLVDDAGNHLSSEPSHVLFLLPGTVSPKHLPCWPLLFRPSPECCPCGEAFSDHKAQTGPLPFGLFPIGNDIISLFLGLLSLPQPEGQSSVSLICFFTPRS